MPLLPLVGFGHCASTLADPAVPPPGDGVVTVIEFALGVAISAAVRKTCNSVGLTYVVVRPLPFRETCEEFTKFVPVIVTIADAPSLALLMARTDCMFFLSSE
jgi:hypothetical protein